MLGPELRFIGRTKVLFEGRAYTFFGGNGHHRLSSHPEVIRAAQEAAAARFLGTEAAVAVSSGYLSNLALLEAVGRDFARFFVDEAAHSIPDRSSRPAP